MMSNCPPEEASEEVGILSQQESTAPVAGMGLGMNTGWSLTSTSGHIPTKAIIVNRANTAGGQGRPLRTGGIVGTGEGALSLIGIGVSARFNGWHVTLW